jgi:Na+/melibiose symporter-like transporter
VNAALAAAATLVAVAFSLSTLDRWLRRRRPYELAWTISLALFATGAAALWWAETRGWSLASFRVFFLAGAVLNVPWLALGTVYLLAGTPAGNRARSWLLFLSGLATGIVLFAPTKVAVRGSDFPTGKDVFGVAPRVLAAVFSGLPALVIIGGALWSAVRLARHRPPALPGVTRAPSPPRRLVLGNLLIAAGTLVLSASGTLAGRLGKDRAFAVTLLVGIVVLFAGFLVASAPAPRIALHAVPRVDDDLEEAAARPARSASTSR